MLGEPPVHSKWEVSAQIMGTAFTISECTDNHNDLVILQHARQFMFHWTAFHLPLLKVIVYDLSFKGQVFPQEMIIPTLLTCSQLHVELFCHSLQCLHCTCQSLWDKIQHLDSSTFWHVMSVLPVESLVLPLCSGWVLVAPPPSLLVETSLWGVHHPTSSPSTHYASPMLDSTPVRPGFKMSQTLLQYH